VSIHRRHVSLRVATAGRSKSSGSQYALRIAYTNTLSCGTSAFEDVDLLSQGEQLKLQFKRAI
jgi:hypothetical protein